MGQDQGVSSLDDFVVDLTPDFKPVTTNVIWTTGNGVNIDIGHMDTDHLQNTVKYLEKRLAGEVLEEMAAYNMLCHNQGEMAEYYIEQDIRQMEDAYEGLRWWFDRLNQELRRRQNG
jgi:hypothetical protein